MVGRWMFLLNRIVGQRNTWKGDIMKNIALGLCLALILLCGLPLFDCPARQFDAGVVPKGSLYFKVHSIVFVTSARFDDSGKAINLPDLSQLSYVDNQFELYYGATSSLMTGILVPVAYTRTSYASGENSSTTKAGNPWIVVEYQFWPEVVCVASSLRVKLPITDIEPLMESSGVEDKEGDIYLFDVEDKQGDVYLASYIDWLMGWGGYINSEIGYNYRMENENHKPCDELKLVVETGLAIVPGLIRIFTYSDYTRFFRCKTNGKRDENCEGYLYTIAAGVRFYMKRNLRVEVLTNATPYGRNRFRGIGGHVGVGYVFGM